MFLKEREIRGGQGWEDGSVSKVPKIQAQGTEFNPQHPHKMLSSGDP